MHLWFSKVKIKGMYAIMHLHIYRYRVKIHCCMLNASENGFVKQTDNLPIQPLFFKG